MKDNEQKDRVRGSLIGGAIGDALGFPVEFIYSYEKIQKRYGENGITRLDTAQWWTESNVGKAVISDDTQMTLFTALGLLNAKEKGMAPVPAICHAYIEWLYTQKGFRSKRFNSCWIGDLPELNVRRAPGHTCITALEKIVEGREPMNDSKGCGGIMRVAPIALFAAKPISAHDYPLCLMDFAKEAGKAAALTHKHPLGYIPAAFLSALVQKLMPYSYLCSNQLRECIDVCFSVVTELYPEHQSHIDYMQKLVNKAIQLSAQNKSDIEAISQLGEGWVAEETLAIAIYCLFKYPDNFEKAIIASVNHSGDSDSTGAVTGNIMGALLGYDAIPDYYKENLELRWLIEELADDLATDIPVEAYVAFETDKYACIINPDKTIKVVNRDEVRFSIIKDGKIIATGTVEEVKGDKSLEDVFLELTENV